MDAVNVEVMFVPPVCVTCLCHLFVSPVCVTCLCHLFVSPGDAHALL